MELIKLNKNNLKEILFYTIEILKKGGMIAYPTETFYGLGVKYDQEDSLKKLYEIKKRPSYKAMPLIIGSKNLLPLLTKGVNEHTIYLMEKYWPGPLTIILPAKKILSDYITSGTHKVAVRIPGESFALDLAQKANFPITATSANPSRMKPAQDAHGVIKYFRDKLDLIIDGGKTPGGLPSTIVEVTGDKIKILREGVIKKEQLLRLFSMRFQSQER
ncbi:MAG: threonylcarbamoyl-AMP synthase [Nitrospirae bacterium]|nr:threonylcarbamoyl-AMP synthase [Nitrospirota bacterium]